MSDEKDDKDDGYEPVVGFAVPIKRVLGHEERPENPDGSRTGLLFMTIEGCTFKDGGLQGSAAATVGAPTVVVEIIGDERDYLTSSKTSSRYVVSAHDIVQVAILAHKARIAGTEPAHDASSGLQFHARRWNTGFSSTADLEHAAIEFAKTANPDAAAVLRRLARLVWIEIGKARNPWFEAAASVPYGLPSEHQARWEGWNRRQIELTRRLFVVVFDKAEPTEELLVEALDFLDGR